MIIDIHAHLANKRIYAKPFLREFYGGDPNLLQSGNNILKVLLNDKDGSQLLKHMDASGIDKTVLNIIDGGIELDKGDLGINSIYKLHYKIQRKHPDRISVFAGIDPRRKKSFKIFKKGIIRFDFKGLKLYPSVGYSVNNPRLEPFYEFCGDNKLPILIHTGFSFPWLKNHYSNINDMIHVTHKYSSTNFIFAHAALDLHNKDFQEILHIPNVYFDMSGFQVNLKRKDLNFKETLNFFFDEEFNKKIFFGTDYPLHNLFVNIKYHIKSLQDLINPNLNEEAKAWENLMGENARQILNI